MAHAEPAAQLTIHVVYSPSAGVVKQVTIGVRPGATVLQALQGSGLLTLFPEIDLDIHRIGVWGKLKSLDSPLRDQDRIEIYRPLRVDPKEARRQRHRSRDKR
jgi:putative ubiquitin-RnfH superfamily antitoxin RatB of RatAB toxin-antitoxin module